MLSSIPSKILLRAFLVVTAACLVTGVDRSKAMGPCVKQQCPANLSCVEDECYKKSDIELTRMADEAVPSIGSCVNNLCPKGYDCVDNNCYKSAAGEAKMAIGPCINDKCPNGFTCESDYKCYP